MSQHDPLNLTVHHRHPKTGKIDRATPYRMHCEGKIRMFEMPKGSGEFFYENGERVPADRKPQLAPASVALTPEEMQEKFDRELAQTRAKNTELERELAAIRTEKAQKAQIQPQKTESKPEVAQSK